MADETHFIGKLKVYSLALEIPLLVGGKFGPEPEPIVKRRIDQLVASCSSYSFPYC